MPDVLAIAGGAVIDVLCEWLNVVIIIRIDLRLVSLFAS
jgi:hypothetical protein